MQRHPTTHMKKKRWFIQPSFHCLLPDLLLMFQNQHRHSDRSASANVTPTGSKLCVLTPLWHSEHFDFQQFVIQSFFWGIELHGPPALLLRAPCAIMTLFYVQLVAFLEPFLVGTNHCIPGTSHETCAFGEAMTHPSSQCGPRKSRSDTRPANSFCF